MISNAFRAAGWLSQNNPAIWDSLGGVIGGAGGLAQTGEWITPDVAMGLPEWLACVRNIADDFGKLPTHVYDQDGNGNRQRARDLRLYDLVHTRFNTDMGAMNFKQLLVNWAYNWEAFRAEIQFDPYDGAVALHPIHPSRITRLIDKATGAAYYDVKLDDLGLKPRRLESWQVYDFHLFGPDGHRGYALQKQGRELIGLGRALAQYAGRFFKSDASPTVAILTEDRMNPTEQAALRQWWIKQHAGVQRSHGVAVLSGKMKLERLDIDPEKAQLLQSRQFTARQFCMLTRFPVAMLGLMDNNYSNSESQREGYYPETIQPLCVLFDQEANWKLLSASDRKRYLIETDMNAVLRGSPKTRAEVQRTRIYSGTLTINRALQMENENTIGPDGDVPLIPANMVPLSAVTSGQTVAGAKSAGNPHSGTDPNPDSGGDKPDTNQARATADLGAVFLPLFEAAAARCVEKQAKAVERKATAKAPEFGDWAITFFGEQVGYWTDAVRPVADAYCRALGVPASLSFEELCRTIAGDSCRDALDAAGRGSIPGLVARWRNELPGLAAAAMQTVIEEEYPHA